LINELLPTFDLGHKGSSSEATSSIQQSDVTVSIGFRPPQEHHFRISRRRHGVEPEPIMADHTDTLPAVMDTREDVKDAEV
jgi:hypothetical protein